MKLQKSLHRNNPPEVAFVHNCIENIYNKRDDFDNAIYSYEKGLKIYISEYGKYHSSVASTLQNIGNLHCRLGKHDLAIQ